MSMRPRLDARFAALLATALAAIACGGASAPALVLVSASPAGASVPVGAVVQYTAEGHYADGSTAPLTEGLIWQAMGAGVASIDATGLVTTHAVGEVSIRVTHLASGLRGVAPLSVTAPVLQSVEVAPVATAISPHSAVLVSAVGRSSDGSSIDLGGLVAWSSSDEAVASVDQQGVVTGLAGGTVTITARLESHGLEGHAELTVTGAVLGQLTLTPAELSLPAGAAAPMAVSGSWSDGTSGPVAGDLQWSAVDAAVATVDGGGVVRSSSEGTTSVSVRHLATGLEATAPVTVTPAALVALELSPPQATMAVGADGSPYRVVGRYSDGRGVQLCPPPQVAYAPPPPALTWTSSSPAVAAVSGCPPPGTGGITATSTGTTTITASVPALGLAAAGLLTVVPDRLERVVVSPATAQLQVGARVSLSASGRMLSGGIVIFTIGRVSWSSDASSVASVDATGHVLAVAPGTATITATETTGPSGTAVITVTP